MNLRYLKINLLPSKIPLPFKITDISSASMYCAHKISSILSYTHNFSKTIDLASQAPQDAIEQIDLTQYTTQPHGARVPLKKALKDITQQSLDWIQDPLRINATTQTLDDSISALIEDSRPTGLQAFQKIPVEPEPLIPPPTFLEQLDAYLERLEPYFGSFDTLPRRC